jgi:hypothetical protein
MRIPVNHALWPCMLRLTSRIERTHRGFDFQRPTEEELLVQVEPVGCAIGYQKPHTKLASKEKEFFAQLDQKPKAARERRSFRRAEARR